MQPDISKEEGEIKSLKDNRKFKRRKVYSEKNVGGEETVRLKKMKGRRSDWEVFREEHKLWV